MANASMPCNVPPARSSRAAIELMRAVVPWTATLYVAPARLRRSGGLGRVLAELRQARLAIYATETSSTRRGRQAHPLDVRAGSGRRPTDPGTGIAKS
jgi:hypothetical protein